MAISKIELENLDFTKLTLNQYIGNLDLMVVWENCFPNFGKTKDISETVLLWYKYLEDKAKKLKTNTRKINLRAKLFSNNERKDNMKTLLVHSQYEDTPYNLNNPHYEIYNDQHMETMDIKYIESQKGKQKHIAVILLNIIE